MNEISLPARHHWAAGFTIIELLLSVAVSIIVMGVIARFAINTLRTNSRISGDLTQLNEAKRTLVILMAEIRTAGPASNGAYPIESATATSFAFYANVDGTPLVERVRYYLDGATLKRGVVIPTSNPVTYDPSREVSSELIHDVAATSTPVFLYYDASYNSVTSTAPLTFPVTIPRVRLVRIQLWMRPLAVPEVPRPLSITTQTAIRYFKDT